MISDEAYRSSTQYRHFSFPSKEKLYAQRAKANANARSQLPQETSYLTVDEEVELVDHYVTKLWDLCRHFKTPSYVRVFSSLCCPSADILTRQQQPASSSAITFTTPL